MKKFFIRFFSLLSSISFLLAGCSASHSQQTIEQNAPSAGHTNSVSQSSGPDGSSQRDPISLTHEIIKLEDGLEAVRFDGDYGFSNFLAQGGASSDSEVIEYLAHNLLGNLNFSGIINGLFGCSTLAAKGLSYVDFAVYFVDKILPDPRTGKKQLIITPCPRETRCAG